MKAERAGRAHAAGRLRKLVEGRNLCGMSEITFTVSPCEETGVLVAAWDAPGGGGITTEGASGEELHANIREALACHFEGSEALR
jgi:predicted RNase H-like HicB family nuclease